MEAIIFDIGSNSLRYYLTESKRKGLVTTRLASGLCATGQMSEEGIRRTIEAMKAIITNELPQKERCYAFATEAVRSARNGQDFVRAVKEQTDLTVDVLSGEEEAEASFLGGNVLKGKNLVCDIGGASSEITVGEKQRILYRVSVPIGAVRLQESCGEDFIKAEAVLENLLKTVDLPDYEHFIAVGGTASAAVTLQKECAYSPDIHLSEVSLLQIEKQWLRICPLSYENRSRLLGMPMGRADVIACGLFILLRIMKKAKASKMVLSDFDNLQGYAKMRKII